MNMTTNGHNQEAQGDPTAPAPTRNTLNLWQKLTAIGREGGTIKKTGKNAHFNYSFIEHSEIMGEYRALLDAYGVTVDMAVTGYQRDSEGRTVLNLEYTVTNADKPTETFTRQWVTEAQDRQDKGVNKALTAGEKQIFMKLFHISDADPDADEPEQPKQQQPKATTSQQKPPAPAQRPATPPPAQPIANGNGAKIQRASELFNAKPVTANNDPTVADFTRIFEGKIKVAQSIRDLKNIGQEISREITGDDNENEAARAVLREMWDARKEELLETK